MKGYLASGWFNEEQERIRLQIIVALRNSGLDFYSPKDDGLYKPGDDFSEIFQTNLDEIAGCDFIVVSTAGKDMGTLFECGFAYCLDTPIIYYWPHKFPMNLMLAASAHSVITSLRSLEDFLVGVANMGGLPDRTIYEGKVE